MTHNQAMKKIRSMMPAVRKGLLKECERLLRSGGIDLSEYGDGFHAPKIVLTVALKNETHQWSPLDWDTSSKKTVKNLEHF